MLRSITFNLRFPHLGIQVRIYCYKLLINPYLSLKANKLDGPSDETGKPEVVWHYKSPCRSRSISAEQLPFLGSDDVFISVKYFQVGR